MTYVFQKKRYVILAGILDKTTRLFYKPHQTLHFDSKAINPKKILIVRLDHLGDVLGATGFPRALKQVFPAAKIIFLTSSLGSAIIRGNPYVDEIIEFNPGWYNRAASARVVDEEAPIVRGLRSRGIDLSLAPRGDIRENYLVWKAGIKTRIGYSITGGAVFLTHEPPYFMQEHESEHSKAMLRMLGLFDFNFSPKIYWASGEEDEISGVLLRKGMDIKGEWTGIQVDAGTSAKQWPTLNYRHFLEFIAQDMPHKKLIFFGQDSSLRSVFNEYIQLFRKQGQWFNMVSSTTLRELIFLISRCRYFIGPDSGPGHIAASFGVPTLMLYSGTNLFEAWKPLSEKAYVFRNKVSCSPCRKISCPVLGHPCMSGILPQDVFGWLRERSHESS